MNNQQRKFLYGASIQGIQSFIFETNELKDIVGASHIINDICKSFHVFAQNKGSNIMAAAGNIKHIFNSKEDCEYIVKNFQKKIITEAPGITISQAVVSYTDNFEQAVNKLEIRLRAQRNKPARSTTIGLIGTKRNPRTGLPASISYKGENLDIGSYIKKTKRDDAHTHLNKSFFGLEIASDLLALDITSMTDKNDWIAIIHADGNGLGKIVSTIGNSADKLKDFSLLLEKATQEAAQSAYQETTQNHKTEAWGTLKKYPFRPIVLGGDDLTLICRADLAIEFTNSFLRNFEAKTHKYLSKFISEAGIGNKLTACAGIAFIKSSYPFYYGYGLDESLCSQAKNDAKESKRLVKGIAKSCLMFHKVQDSFVEDYKRIIQRELTTKAKISLCFGPYYTEQTEQRWTIDKMLLSCQMLDQKTDIGVKTHLRRWLSLLDTNPGLAEQRLHRLKSLLEINKAANKEILDLVQEVTTSKTPVYDILSLLSITNQVTNNN
ncbi:MAG: Cas10/Cmr2 second palm domain-containing protein [Tannerellaceae bacterium]